MVGVEYRMWSTARRISVRSFERKYQTCCGEYISRTPDSTFRERKKRICFSVTAVLYHLRSPNIYARILARYIVQSTDNRRSDTYKSDVLLPSHPSGVLPEIHSRDINRDRKERKYFQHYSPVCAPAGAIIGIFFRLLTAGYFYCCYNYF